MIDSNASLNRISLKLSKLKLTNILWQPRCQSPRLVFVKGSKGRYESSTSVSLESYFKDLYGAQKKNKTKQNKYIIIHIHIYIYIYKNQEIYISCTFSHVHEIYRELYMGARRYGISLRVFNSISHEWDVEFYTRREIPLSICNHVLFCLSYKHNSPLLRRKAGFTNEWK